MKRVQTLREEIIEKVYSKYKAKALKWIPSPLTIENIKTEDPFEYFMKLDIWTLEKEEDLKYLIKDYYVEATDSWEALLA